MKIVLRRDIEPPQMHGRVLMTREADVPNFTGLLSLEQRGKRTVVEEAVGILQANAMPAGDFRDWPAIEAWARGLAEGLQPPTANVMR